MSAGRHIGIRSALALLVAAVVGGCADLLVPETAAPVPAREWIITVTNASDEQAVLVVAEDGPQGPGARVGTAKPDVIPPNAAQEVVFTVPAGTEWAIFVNPNPQRGPLILARDVPADASGELPIEIRVGANGEPSVSAPGEPGWFGN